MPNRAKAPAELKFTDPAMTFGEIARELGVSQAAVFQTYQAAMKKLTRGDRLMTLKKAAELQRARER